MQEHDKITVVLLYWMQIKRWGDIWFLPECHPTEKFVVIPTLYVDSVPFSNVRGLHENLAKRGMGVNVAANLGGC